jgi:hypothetical protein
MMDLSKESRSTAASSDRAGSYSHFNQYYQPNWHPRSAASIRIDPNRATIYHARKSSHDNGKTDRANQRREQHRMKAAHRKELHTNLLADRMGRLVEGMKTAPRSTSLMVWVFVVLALGTLGVWRYAASATYSQRSALWVSVDTASHNPENGIRQLANIGKEIPGSLAGRTARFELARIRLEQGQTSLTAFVQRAGAVESVEEARRLYGQLVNECADSPLLTQEAMMGVAKAEESLAGVADPKDPEKKLGDLGRALEDYQQLAAKYPDSVLGKAAAKRAEELQQQGSEVERFYKELNQIFASKPKTESERKAESEKAAP